MNDATNASANDAGRSASLVTAGAGTRPSVRLERDLPDPPGAVWRALTDPDELKSWFPCEIVTERCGVGAALSFPFPGHDAYNMTGVVRECYGPQVLAYT